MKVMLCIKRMLPLILGLSLALACEKKPVNPGGNGGDDPETPVNPPVEIPEPPKDIVQANLFMVDFFSTLDEVGFFITHDENTVKAHIKAQQAPGPVVYMVDRCDYVAGNLNPMVKLGVELKYRPFFAQTERTGREVTKGTGLLTVDNPVRYDGIATGTAFMSGLSINIPLATPRLVTIYTTRLVSVSRMEEIVGHRSAILKDEAVVIGTVSADIVDGLKKYAAEELGFRMEYFGSGNTYDVFVLCNPGYVCRSISEGKRDGCPYYRIAIERLN